MRAIVLIGVAAIVSITGCAGTQDTTMIHEEMEKVGKHYEQSIAKRTDNGHFTIEIVIPEKDLRMGVNTFELIVHDRKNKDVPDAEVAITPWMPGMGHGVMEQPVVVERGGGLYSVNNVILSMTGHWQLKIKVSHSGTEDNVVFDFPEVKAMGHEHAAMKAAAPSDLDISAKQLSENKLFEVSYESLRGRIPTNRIHSWNLNIKTADGKPVDDAKVTIVGDMPEHGHGFPTQPEIVKGMAPGNYLVDGVKFSMPGWWVVTFHIMAGEIMDSVTFNLQLR